MKPSTIKVETVSGAIIDLCNLHPHDIVLTDVVQGLSYIKRFNGRRAEVPTGGVFGNAVGGVCSRSITDNGVSVLQHSYAMYLFAKETYPDFPRLALECLLHDAPEAYTGDIISPIKQHIPWLAEIERDIVEILATGYGLPYPDSEALGDIDILARQIEWEVVVKVNTNMPTEAFALYLAENSTSDQRHQMRSALISTLRLSREELVDKVLLTLYEAAVNHRRECWLSDYEKPVAAPHPIQQSALVSDGDLTPAEQGHTPAYNATIDGGYEVENATPRSPYDRAPTLAEVLQFRVGQRGMLQFNTHSDYEVFISELNNSNEVLNKGYVFNDEIIPDRHTFDVVCRIKRVK